MEKYKAVQVYHVYEDRNKEDYELLSNFFSLAKSQKPEHITGI